MFQIGFNKSKYANPYYFSASQLSASLRLKKAIEETATGLGVEVACTLCGGHRNTTGFDAVLSVDTVASISLFEHLWKDGYDVKLLEAKE